MDERMFFYISGDAICVNSEYCFVVGALYGYRICCIT